MSIYRYDLHLVAAPGSQQADPDDEDPDGEQDRPEVDQGDQPVRAE
jgi:hypothetical protein